MPEHTETSSDQKDKILTKRNYSKWRAKLEIESMGYFGMYHLLTTGSELSFQVKVPDTRKAIVLEGEGVTPENRRKEGYVTDERGGFVYLSDREVALNDREYVEKKKDLAVDEKKYNENKRILCKYINVNLDKGLRDKVNVKRTKINELLTNNDLLGVVKLVKKLATGGGTSTVVLDSQSFLNLRAGESYAEFTVAFRDTLEQLKSNRSIEEVFKGIVNGHFVSCLQHFKGLEFQMEQILETEEYPDWENISEKFENILAAKEHMKEKLARKDADHGMIEANLAEGNMKKKFKMICFKCGNEGHAAGSSKCGGGTIPKCSKCGKSHHTNAHEAFSIISSKLKDKGYKPSDKVLEYAREVKGLMTRMDEEDDYDYEENEEQTAMCMSVDALSSKIMFKEEDDYLKSSGLEEDEDMIPWETKGYMFSVEEDQDEEEDNQEEDGWCTEAELKRLLERRSNGEVFEVWAGEIVKDEDDSMEEEREEKDQIQYNSYERCNVVGQSRNLLRRNILLAYGEEMTKRDQESGDDRDSSDSNSTLSTTVSEEEIEALRIVRGKREIRECGTTLEADMERFVDYPGGPKFFKINYITGKEIFKIIGDCNLMVSGNVGLLGKLREFQGTSLMVKNIKDVERIQEGDGKIQWEVVKEVLIKSMEWRVNMEQVKKERIEIKRRLKYFEKD